MKFLILIGLVLFSSLLTGDALAAGTIGIAPGVARDAVVSIKFLDAFFGTEGEKIEVNPGDTNIPFTVTLANVGTQDITGIKSTLQLPQGFTSYKGKGYAITSDYNSSAEAGKTFSITFYIDIHDGIKIKNYPGAITVDYSRLRESGERHDLFNFDFKVTGNSIINVKSENPFLTSITNNLVLLEFSNSGTAPLSNVDVVLKNTQTSVSSTSTSITNMESVIFDKTHWDLGTILPDSKKTFSFNVFIPESLSNEPLHPSFDITYYDAHGQKKTVSRTVDFYVNGLIDVSLYDVKVIELSGKQTVVGEILNEGNTDGLFAFVTLEPRQNSNIKSSTQFIDEIEPDSPVPFNIPIEFDGEPVFGQHDIRIILKYKDSLRNDKILDEDYTITVKEIVDSENDSPESMMAILAAIIIVAITGILIRKKQSKQIS